ncbi:MAG: InlB B-repeat-containing protein, partial [Acutalibacteraceae bacterium]
MKKIKRVIATLLSLIMILSIAPISNFFGADIGVSFEAEAADGKYVVNNVTIPIGKWVNNGPNYGECWAFAQFVYGKLWNGKRFSSTRGTSDDMLRKVPAGREREITAANAKKYISFAQPGATIRVADYIDGNDGYGKAKNIHSMILVAKDANGCVIYDSNITFGTEKRTRLRYYTWKQFESSFKSDKYFKYIKWPGAPVYTSGLTITNNAVSNIGNTSVTINAQASSSLPVQKWGYIISTDKNIIDNTDGTVASTHVDNPSKNFDYTKVLDSNDSPKSINKFTTKISKILGNDLKTNTTYYYKVLVKSSGSWYQSKTASFKTGNSLPGAPTLQIAGGKTDVAISDSIAVTWSSVSNAESYNLNVYDSDGGVVYNKNGIKGNSLTLSDVLKSAGDYYVSLTAVNAMGKTDSKDKLKITVHADNVVKFCDTISGEVLKTEVVPYGHSATAPSAPSQKGYTFIKWDKSLDNITENVEINTVYEAHKYTVTFVDSKGNLISKEIVKQDEAVKNVPEAPAKSGYTFVAWTVKSGSGSSYTRVDGDVTFEPTYLWENPDLPLSVEVKSALRNSNARGYTVTSNIVNGSDKDITAKLNNPSKAAIITA